MEGMGLKLIIVVVRCLLGAPSMFGPIADTCWIVQTVLTEGIACLWLPTPLYVPLMILQWL